MNAEPAQPGPRKPGDAHSEHAGRRQQLAGVDEISAALDAGASLRLVLVADAPRDPRTPALLARVRKLGITVQRSSANALRRLSKSDPPRELLALLGPAPDAKLDEALQGRGAFWQLVGVAYPGNAGFAIRTADVSGADGIGLDCSFGHDARREALRAAMRADRYLPVFWERTAEVMEQARAAGRSVLAVEDVGSAAPWAFDLARPLLLVLGGERHGIPGELLRACDDVIRIPMRGFIPSYNVQAAMAIVAGERLRQLGAG